MAQVGAPGARDFESLPFSAVFERDDAAALERLLCEENGGQEFRVFEADDADDDAVHFETPVFSKKTEYLIFFEVFGMFKLSFLHFLCGKGAVDCLRLFSRKLDEYGAAKNRRSPGTGKSGAQYLKHLLGMRKTSDLELPAHYVMQSGGDKAAEMLELMVELLGGGENKENKSNENKSNGGGAAAVSVGAADSGGGAASAVRGMLTAQNDSGETPLHVGVGQLTKKKGLRHIQTCARLGIAVSNNYLDIKEEAGLTAAQYAFVYTDLGKEVETALEEVRARTVRSSPASPDGKAKTAEATEQAAAAEREEPVSSRGAGVVGRVTSVEATERKSESGDIEVIQRGSVRDRIKALEGK